MTTQDFRRKSPLVIFLGYFKNHKRLFLADVTCPTCDHPRSYFELNAENY